MARRIVLLALLGGVLGLSTVARGSRPSESPSREKVEPDVAPVAMEGGAPAPGDIFEYALASRVQTKLVTGAPCAESREVTYTMRGTLRMIVYAADAHRLTMGWALVGLAVEFVPAPEERGREELARQLSREFVVDVSRSGGPPLLAVPREMSADARRFVRSLVHQVSLPPPTRAGQSSWDQEEDDAVGRCVARYGTRAVAGGTEVRRVKLRYLRVRSAGAPLPGSPAVEVQGGAEGLFNEWWSRVGVDETVQVRGAGILEEATVRERTTLTLRRRAHEPPVDGRLAGLRASCEAAGLEPDAPSEDAVRRRLAGDATLEGLLAELQSALADQEWTGPATELCERLSAVLALDDAAAAHALWLLRGGALPDGVREALVYALGSAGTRAAQDALAQFVTHAADGPLREAAMLALGLTAHPTHESAHILRQLAAAGSSRALLSLGIMTRTLAEGEPDRARDLSAWLFRLAEQAREPEQKRLCLDALGNAAAPGTVEAVRRHLDDPDAGVRAAAVFALRLVPEPAADELLGRSMAYDPAADVRSSAVEALTYRTTQEAEVLLFVASQHPEEDVRRRVLRHYAGRFPEDPTAGAVLRAMAAEDPSPELRRTAREVLGE